MHSLKRIGSNYWIRSCQTVQFDFLAKDLLPSKMQPQSILERKLSDSYPVQKTLHSSDFSEGIPVEVPWVRLAKWTFQWINPGLVNQWKLCLRNFDANNQLPITNITLTR